MKRFNIDKNAINRYGKIYFNRQINRIILVLVVLLVVLVAKIVNTKVTNNFIQAIEKNIYYEFSLKEDGKKVKDYFIKTVGDSKVVIEELAKEIINNIE